MKELIDTVWENYDTNGNKFLDSDELNQFLNDVYGNDQESEELKKKIRRLIDKNGDNKISKIELEKILTKFS